MTVTTIELDDRGLVMACPQCGQRNRLIYERLGQIFRCGSSAGGILGAVVWTLQNGRTRTGQSRRRRAGPMARNQGQYLR